MAYSVNVYLQQVVCRDPESVTTGDRFVIAGAVTTKDSASVFIEPIRILRKNESFGYNEMIFSDIVWGTEVGIAFTAWDKDLNSPWMNNRDEIDQKRKEILGFIDKAGILGETVFDIVNAAAGFLYQSIDVMVLRDLDDLLVDFKHVYQLQDLTPGATQVDAYEISFRNRGTSYSDWDYSVFVAIEYSALFPDLGPAYRQEEFKFIDFDYRRRPSRVIDWIGRWEGSNGEVGALVGISQGSSPHLMDVSITEQGPSGTKTRQWTGIPISRVFFEEGQRNLVKTSDPFIQANSAQTQGVSLSSVSSAVTKVSLVSVIGDDIITSRPISRVDMVTNPSSVRYRKQIGTDIVWLGDIVLEAYRARGEDGQEGVMIRYLRPITNVLYRETGAQISIDLWRPVL